VNDSSFSTRTLARKHGAKIIVLNCVEVVPPSNFYEGIAGTPARVQRAKERQTEVHIAEIEKRMEEFCKRGESQIGSLCVDLVAETIVTDGFPVEEILNTADAKGCDVIVLGTHAKGWLKQTFLASTARSVLERTRKPVFIVPLPSEKTSIEGLRSNSNVTVINRRWTEEKEEEDDATNQKDSLRN